MQSKPGIRMEYKKTWAWPLRFRIYGNIAQQQGYERRSHDEEPMAKEHDADE